MELIDITICIPTIPTRESLLNRLLHGIQSQLRPNIEVLIIDGPGRQGDKLNHCFSAAKGTYVVAVDDDDLLAEDYVESISEYLKSGVDYIGYNIKWMEDGVFQKSVPHRGDGDPLWESYDNRGACPKCLIKKEIAMRHSFGNEYSSDFFWSKAIHSDIRTHAFIDKDLYIYDHWNSFMSNCDGTEEQRAEQLEKPMRFVGTYDIDKTRFTWL